MIDEHLAAASETTVLVTVTVARRDLHARAQVVASYRRGRHRQTFPILDRPLPPPPEGAEWLEAYRKWRGDG